MRLIDADALKKAIEEYHMGLKPRYITKLVDAEIADIQDIVDEAPTIESEPVRHSMWGNSEIIAYDGVYPVYAVPCKACGMYTTEHFRPYCPNCGAKMDGGAENGGQ